jgi:hypothetical protein
LSDNLVQLLSRDSNYQAGTVDTECIERQLYLGLTGIQSRAICSNGGNFANRLSVHISKLSAGADVSSRRRPRLRLGWRGGGNSLCMRLGNNVIEFRRSGSEYETRLVDADRNQRHPGFVLTRIDHDAVGIDRVNLADWLSINIPKGRTRRHVGGGRFANGAFRNDRLSSIEIVHDMREALGLLAAAIRGRI